MLIKETIEKLLQSAIKKNTAQLVLVLVEAPKEKTHGDFATSVALALSKKLGKSPVEVAKGIVGSIKKPVFIEKIEVAGPGFINFYLAGEVFNENVKAVLKEKGGYGKNTLLKNKKVMVEYTDPNILKDFHIGHLMSNTIGESLSRILNFQGANIKRANYQSDVGLGIAKAVWGKMAQPGLSWQQAYVFGTKEFDENENTKKEIIELNKKIFERSDKAVNKLYDEGKKWSLKYFEGIYAKLGTKFDYYFFESQVADDGKKIVEKNIGKVFEKGENGAIIFKGENVGLHTRVFINSEGLPTYEAKELALASEKYKKYKYDASVIVTANEINEYFKVLMAAMAQIFPDLQKITRHIGHGMMRLPEGKMSSRTGKVITAEFLINQLEELLKEKIKGRDFSETEEKEVLEKVAIGAVKYSILKQSIGSDIIYDIDKSITFEGDSGPYLQYAYARAMSILRKAKEEGVKASLKATPGETSPLVKMMYHFTEIVEKAGKELEPHYVTLYLTQLASEFNVYYAHNKIVDKKDRLSPHKIAITQAFAQIMKNGLWLLGIGVLEKM